MANQTESSCDLSRWLHVVCCNWVNNNGAWAEEGFFFKPIFVVSFGTVSRHDMFSLCFAFPKLTPKLILVSNWWHLHSWPWRARCLQTIAAIAQKERQREIKEKTTMKHKFTTKWIVNPWQRKPDMQTGKSSQLVFSITCLPWTAGA